MLSGNYDAFAWFRFESVARETVPAPTATDVIIEFRRVIAGVESVIGTTSAIRIGSDALNIPISGGSLSYNATTNFITANNVPFFTSAIATPPESIRVYMKTVT